MHFSDKYEAYMFPVAYMYNRYGIYGREEGGYQWTLSQGPFHQPSFQADRNQFFGAGRYAYYHILTKAYNDSGEWTRPRPAFSGGRDYYMGTRWGTAGKFVSAINNGGGALYSNADAQGPWESFYLNDMNGGSLENGDLVTIRTTSGWYWSATNGGGSTLNANVTTPITWEVFTVQKYGWGMIQEGDAFRLQTYDGAHYVNGVYGGQMSASDTGSNPAVFTFTHVNDYSLP